VLIQYPHKWDSEWISYNITYGIFLGPCAEDGKHTPGAPLSFAETEMVALLCLIGQRALRETVALRNGLDRDEVKKCGRNGCERVWGGCRVRRALCLVEDERRSS
jgi:hypothetical protein